MRKASLKGECSLFIKRWFSCVASSRCPGIAVFVPVKGVKTYREAKSVQDLVLHVAQQGF